MSTDQLRLEVIAAQRNLRAVALDVALLLAKGEPSEEGRQRMARNLNDAVIRVNRALDAEAFRSFDHAGRD